MTNHAVVRISEPKQPHETDEEFAERRAEYFRQLDADQERAQAIRDRVRRRIETGKWE